MSFRAAAGNLRRTSFSPVERRNSFPFSPSASIAERRWQPLIRHTPVHCGDENGAMTRRSSAAMKKRRDRGREGRRERESRRKRWHL